METIRYCLKKNNTCVMALVYETNGGKQKKCIEC